MKVIFVQGCFLIGGLAALGGILLLYNTCRFLRRGVRSEGKVVGYESEEDNDFGVTLYIRVSFEDTEGLKRLITVKNIGGSTRDFDEGSRVRIVFDPHNPEDTRIDSFAGIWSPIVISTVGAILFVIVGIFVWLFA